jgi:cytochrome c oxidase subunit 2
MVLAGCGGPQSALDPAGHAAEQIADLFWWMVAGAVVIWITVAALFFDAVRRREQRSERWGRLLILWAGAVGPAVVLGLLLACGLARLPSLVALAPEGSLKIAVAGEQWWWRVSYLQPDGRTIELANEIRLPVGEPVDFHLTSSNVIHSFWIPSLGGKRDMIPGRLTRLTLTPTRTGIFRGVCAEYCGTSHALMSFDVVVLEKVEFARWLVRQSESAQASDEPARAHGQEQFLANGCGACHTVRGTPATGVIGPDLTHVGSRRSLGAGTLHNEPEAFLRLIAHTPTVKPGVHMPSFGMLASEDLGALAIYLEGLK